MSTLGRPKVTPAVSAVGRVVDQRRDAEERLGRDAADVEALAAERSAGLDEHRVEPEIGRAERGGVAARASAQHDEIDLAEQLAHDHGRRPSLSLEEEPLGSLEQPDELASRSAPPPCRR